MKLIFVLGILIIFIAVACTLVKENPTIEDIVKHPGAYEGKTVIVNGTYYGWSSPDSGCKNEPYMRTKSDSMIASNSYCMFLTGGEIISPEEGVSDPFTTKDVTIKAKVRLFNRKPILDDVD